VLVGIFHFPVKIISTDGCLSSIDDEVNQLGARHPLIVTDPGIVAAGIVDKLTGPLKDKALPYGVFEGVEPDPKIRNASDAANVVKKWSRPDPPGGGRASGRHWDTETAF
jgi:alcohol dehydrogenase class IV